MASPSSSPSPSPSPSPSFPPYDRISVSLPFPDVALISFSRPHVRNAMDSATYTQLASALTSASLSPSLRAVILTGHGSFFTAGADISEADLPSYRAAMVDPSSAPVGLFMLSVLRFPKLLFAAVNGPAVGIGVTLLPHCDVSWAADEVTFWTPFVRLAVVPEFCSSVTFPRLMGAATAGEVLLAGRRLGAQEGRDLGLVADVLPKEGFLEAVFDRVRKILDQPMAESSLPLFKKMLKKPFAAELEAAFRYEMEELGKRSVKGETSRAVALLLAERKAESKALKSKL